MARPAAIVVALISGLVFAASSAAVPSYVSQWGNGGEAESQFLNPRGVGVDAAGNVYVADSGNHRVQKFSADGVFKRMWGFDVAGGGQAEICTGGCQAPAATSGVLGGFSSPFGIAVSSNNVYVADDGNNRIQRFSLDGTSPLAWGSIGPGAGHFNGAPGVAVDGSGNVYVADEFNRRVQKFDANGNFLRMWGWDVDSQAPGTGFEICTVAANCKQGISGTADGQFIQPEDLATDGAGTVYVVEGGEAGGPIQRFDLNGNFLGRWAGDPEGTGDGQFNQPRGIGVAGSGAVLVADQNNRRIQRFTAVGGFIDKWGTLGTGDGQFTAPYDVVTGPGGFFYTSDTSLHRIQRFFEALPPSQPPPTPALGRTVNVSVVRGTVLVAVPARKSAGASVHASQKGLRFVPLTAARQIPVRSFLNTRRGTVRLRSARNSAGATQSGDFSAGVFQVLQSRRAKAKGLTELRLKGSSFKRCAPAGRGKRRGRRSDAVGSAGRTIRRLRGSANGRFRTRGRNSSATVRGTIWTVTDRCDGTLTTVKRGRVAVRDFRARKTIVVRAGKSYLAKARR